MTSRPLVPREAKITNAYKQLRNAPHTVKPAAAKYSANLGFMIPPDRGPSQGVSNKLLKSRIKLPLCWGTGNTRVPLASGNRPVNDDDD